MNCTVDLSTRAVAIAMQLSALTYFLEGAQELQTCRYLTPTEFRRHSTKIVRLIEIAQKTLQSAGVPLYFHLPCRPIHGAYKEAYIELLKVLKERHYDIDDKLSARKRNLLRPLCSGIILQASGTAAPAMALPSPRLRQTRQRGTASTTAFTNVSEPSCTTGTRADMPPPSSTSPLDRLARPPKTVRRRTPMWNFEEVMGFGLRPKRPKHRRRDENEPEDEEPTEASQPRLLKPLPRRFGIFCTGKVSMHGTRERTGRAKGQRRRTSV